MSEETKAEATAPAVAPKTIKPKPALPVKKKGGRPKGSKTNRPATWEEALATLPPNATSETEMNWIAAHPAMFQKTRETDAKKNKLQIILSGDDVLKPPHGPSPSRAAAVSLQYWCNNHDMFFRQILMEQKKKVKKTSDPNSPTGSEVGDDVKDLESYLDELE